jgi:hypothetical protein
MELPEDISPPPDSPDAPAALSLGDDATNRRRSGRERKKPTGYAVPAVPSQNGVNGKRKRVNGEGHTEEDEGGADGSDDEDDDEESEGEADAEELREAKRKAAAARRARAKPPAKKPKTKASVGGKTLAVRSAPRRPPPRPRAVSGAEGSDDQDEDGLYGEQPSTALTRG